MTVLLEVDNLGKRYALAHLNRSSSLRAAVSRIPSLFKRNSQTVTEEDFWALREVSFQLRAGECLGILGKNGSGKSTMLKLLSRVVHPTEGVIKARGRLAALLEVGTGFHPELSGRENIFLNGAILGIPQREIAKKFDSIVDFSEVEQFLDTPVKHYSSGMYVRLAFAIAAHIQPDVLVVDEVLAVGDEAFQEKCLQRLKDMVAGGTSLLFVSHDYDLTERLSTEVLWLQQGRARAYSRNVSELVSTFRQTLLGHQ